MSDTMDTWEVAYEDDETESAIVGRYGENGDGEPFTIIGTLTKDGDEGYFWAIEDDYVGPINNGWEASKSEAQSAAFTAAEKWATEDEVQS